MSARSFLDTNIFLYAHDSTSPNKRKIARDLIEREYADRNCSISTQVMAEFFQNFTVKFRNPYADSLRELHYMSRCPVVEQSMALLLCGTSIFNQYSVSFWDAMIIAAAREARAAILYTEDLQDGQVIEDVKITNPFNHQ